MSCWRPSCTPIVSPAAFLSSLLQVFHLGEGMDSKNWMSRNGGDVGKMYLNHIREVVSFVASWASGQQVLFWDDMLRKISVAAIQGQCGSLCRCLSR